MSGSVPPLRVTSCNKTPVNPGGDFVLYWMTAARRVSWNFALDRAVEWARELQKPPLGDWRPFGATTSGPATGSMPLSWKGWPITPVS